MIHCPALICSSLLLLLLGTHQKTGRVWFLPTAPVSHHLAFLEGHGSVILSAINRRRLSAPPWRSGSVPEGSSQDLPPQLAASAGQPRHSIHQSVCLFSCGRTVSTALWSHFCATPWRSQVECIGSNTPVQQELGSPSIGDTSRGPL